MAIASPQRETTIQRLDRIGIAGHDLDTFEDLRDTKVFTLTTDLRTSTLCGHGYTSIDTLDAIWHELEEGPAHLYMQHGLTPHQAFLLDTSVAAQANLWGPDRDTARAHRLLSAKVPAELLVHHLRTAMDPDEAEHLIDAEVAAATSGEDGALPRGGVAGGGCDCG